MQATRQLHPFYTRLAFFAFLLAFIVILLGAYTRLTNAGLSCPDWPRCYGYLIPPNGTLELAEAAKSYPTLPVDQARAWTEMRHRYLAGFEGLLILSLMALSYRFRRDLSPLARGLSLSLGFILLGQVLLGMLTVTALLKPIIVLGHLLFGFSLMSVLWLLFLLSKNPYPRPSSSFLRRGLMLGLLCLILQITLGGWVSTHSAGLACIDFPYCQGELLPSLQWHALHTDLITIHMLHRLGALLTFSVLSVLSIALLREPRTRAGGLMLLGLLCLQVTLGILNILWLRPLYLALPHHALGALLLLCLLYLLVRLTRQGTPT